MERTRALFDLSCADPVFDDDYQYKGYSRFGFVEYAEVSAALSGGSAGGSSLFRWRRTIHVQFKGKKNAFLSCWDVWSEA
eukprot:6208247-Pleurochrysis_carterae.AAC.1